MKNTPRLAVDMRWDIILSTFTLNYLSLFSPSNTILIVDNIYINKKIPNSEVAPAYFIIFSQYM